VESVLLAESAILVSLQPVRRIFLFFHRIVVTLLALRAGKSDFNSHNGTSIWIIYLPLKPKKRAQKNSPHSEVNIIYHNPELLSRIFFAFISQIIKYKAKTLETYGWNCYNACVVI
jgi:hypothetical protein